MKFLALAIAALATTTQGYDLTKFTEGVEAEVDLGPTTGLDIGGRVGVGGAREVGLFVGSTAGAGYGTGLTPGGTVQIDSGVDDNATDRAHFARAILGSNRLSGNTAGYLAGKALAARLPAKERYRVRLYGTRQELPEEPTRGENGNILVDADRTLAAAGGLTKPIVASDGIVGDRVIAGGAIPTRVGGNVILDGGLGESFGQAGAVIAGSGQGGSDLGVGVGTTVGTDIVNGLGTVGAVKEEGTEIAPRKLYRRLVKLADGTLAYQRVGGRFGGLGRYGVVKGYYPVDPYYHW